MGPPLSALPPALPQDLGDLARERALLVAYAAGDRSAAERLVEGSYRQVFGFLSKLTAGDAEQAADLTQEVYRKAWSALPSFDGRSRFSTWLCRIAYTTFLNDIRRPRRLVAFDEQREARVPDPRPAADELLGQSASTDRLRRAVMALPETLRSAVTAYFWSETPVHEIARQEGVTGVAIRKRIKKALSALAQALEEEV